MDKVPTENIDVWPFSAWKWPVNPYDISRSNTYGYFVPQPRFLELVGVVLWIVFFPLVDLTIRTVYSNQAGLPSLGPLFLALAAATKPIFPKNL